MDTTHLLNVVFVISLTGAGLAGLLGLAVLPSGAYRAVHRHDHTRLHLTTTCFAIMTFFVVICLVLYFTALKGSEF